MKPKTSKNQQRAADRFNLFLDRISDFLSRRKGLLPVLGIVLVTLNFALQFISSGWFGETNLLLHLGLIIAILGFLIAWAL